MENYERTLAIIKPDGMKFKDAIVRRIRDAGFAIVQSRIVRLTPEQAAEFYQSKRDHPNYHALIVALTEGPIQAMCVSKIRAVKELLWLIGPERHQDALRSAPGSLRAMFADSRDELRNAIHGSEDAASARYEVQFFFPALLLEPIFNEQNLNNYLSAMVNPTLMDGLYVMAKERPEEPVMWLSNWLLLNNPYKPKINATPTAEVVYNVGKTVGAQGTTHLESASMGAQSLCECSDFKREGVCTCPLSAIGQLELH